MSRRFAEGFRRFAEAAYIRRPVTGGSHNYLTGTSFRQRVEAIVTTFVGMKEDLDQEKRAMTRIWAKRDKQIERVVDNIGRMYGNIQGIAGASLPPIASLELAQLPSGSPASGAQ